MVTFSAVLKLPEAMFWLLLKTVSPTLFMSAMVRLLFALAVNNTFNTVFAGTGNMARLISLAPVFGGTIYMKLADVSVQPVVSVTSNLKLPLVVGV